MVELKRGHSRNILGNPLGSTVYLTTLFVYVKSALYSPCNEELRTHFLPIVIITDFSC